MTETSLSKQVDKPIAIQGYEGSFHQVAARQFFGKGVAVECCATFRELRCGRRMLCYI